MALGGSVHQWLERIKQGYGRFNVAFEALGVEDTADISNVDHAIFAQIETLLREACDAKSMHIKNIRLALQDAGCILSGPAVAAASAPAPSSVPVKRTAVGLPPSPQQQQQHMRRRAQSPSISPACSSSVAAAASPLRRTGRKPSPTLPSPAGAPSSVPPLPPPFFLPAAVEALAGASMITEATQVWAATAHAPSAEAPKPPRPLLRQSDSGLARAEQWEEVVSAMTAQAQAAGGLWPRLAYGVETEAELQKFFSRRQVGTAGGKTLHIASAVKVVNNAALTAFASAHAGFHMNPLKAHKAGGDTLLFHGCPQESATNIQAGAPSSPLASVGSLLTLTRHPHPHPRSPLTSYPSPFTLTLDPPDGLKMGYAANGMLGKGLCIALRPNLPRSPLRVLFRDGAPPVLIHMYITLILMHAYILQMGRLILVSRSSFARIRPMASSCSSVGST